MTVSELVDLSLVPAQAEPFLRTPVGGIKLEQGQGQGALPVGQVGEPGCTPWHKGTNTAAAGLPKATVTVGVDTGAPCGRFNRESATPEFPAGSLHIAHMWFLYLYLLEDENLPQGGNRATRDRDEHGDDDGYHEATTNGGSTGDLP